MSLRSQSARAPATGLRAPCLLSRGLQRINLFLELGEVDLCRPGDCGLVGDILALVRRHWCPLSLLKGTVLFVFTRPDCGAARGGFWCCLALPGWLCWEPQPCRWAAGCQFGAGHPRSFLSWGKCDRRAGESCRVPGEPVLSRSVVLGSRGEHTNTGTAAPEQHSPATHPSNFLARLN